jgi:hypothetical protein
MEVMTKVVKNHRNKAFGIYTEDDIEQEAWTIILEKLPDFAYDRSKVKDVKKSLEHWLNTILSNRLKNLFRDKFLVPQRMIPSKKERPANNLLSPLDIQFAMEDSSTHYLESMDNEFWEFLLREIPVPFLDILESLMSGERINCYYKGKLSEQIAALKEKFYGNDPTEAERDSRSFHSKA